MPRAGTAADSLAVRRHVEVDGANLTSATAGQDSRRGEWVVNFALDRVGAKRFADVSTQHVGEPFAIVLDNKVISAPVIREPILGGQGQISGNFTVEGANDLAVLLRAGALPAPLTVVEEQSIGSSLGANSIRSGVMAVSSQIRPHGRRLSWRSTGSSAALPLSLSSPIWRSPLLGCRCWAPP